MSSYAIVNKDGLVTNAILWDPSDQPDYDYGKAEGNQAILIEEGVAAGPGFTYRDGKFYQPVPTAEQVEQQKQQLINGNNNQKKYLLDTASQKISIYTDAVELDMATDDEARLLPLWKKYRVILNRIDANTSDTITWPEKPV